ncbi:MAG: recombinase family protein [Planctomycetota bacterium]
MIARTKPKPVRCAIYTRQSVSEVSDEFSSWEAQREAGEAYIRLQRERGWVLVPTRYDDPNISATRHDRPALQRLLADVDAGLLDCVVVTKVDRMVRSLTHFVRVMARLAERGVAFTAVTQQFETGTPTGRLTLNMLICFAEFEREMTAERTREKVCAARKRGRWTGGPPPLGYDLAPEGGRLVVNATEAKRVRAIFDLYLSTGSLTATVQALNDRRWRTKTWTTRKDRVQQGRPWTKYTLRSLLSNPLYVGRVRLGTEVHDGQHESIVPQDTFDRVQAALTDRAGPGGRQGGRTGSALLAGLLRCAPCDAAMSPTHTKRRGKAYRYYVCARTRSQGWAACASPSVAAHDIEALVIEQIRAIGRDKAVQTAVLDAVKAKGVAVEPAELRRVLTLFDPLWDVLHAQEQQRILRLLVERVAYDGAAGTAAVTFRPVGIRTLAGEVAP